LPEDFDIGKSFTLKLAGGGEKGVPKGIETNSWMAKWPGGGPPHVAMGGAGYGRVWGFGGDARGHRFEAAGPISA
jgi:hypothetical protein